MNRHELLSKRRLVGYRATLKTAITFLALFAIGCERAPKMNRVMGGWSLESAFRDVQPEYQLECIGADGGCGKDSASETKSFAVTGKEPLSEDFLARLMKAAQSQVIHLGGTIVKSEHASKFGPSKDPRYQNVQIIWGSIEYLAAETRGTIRLRYALKKELGRVGELSYTHTWHEKKS